MPIFEYQCRGAGGSLNNWCLNFRKLCNVLHAGHEVKKEIFCVWYEKWGKKFVPSSGNSCGSVHRIHAQAAIIRVVYVHRLVQIPAIFGNTA